MVSEAYESQQQGKKMVSSPSLRFCFIAYRELTALSTISPTIGSQLENLVPIVRLLVSKRQTCSRSGCMYYGWSSLAEQRTGPCILTIYTNISSKTGILCTSLQIEFLTSNYMGT